MAHREISPGSTYREREQLGLMRRRYRDGRIRGVVVTTLDRLSRDLVHLAILMGEMEKYGITLHSVHEGAGGAFTGDFARLILDFVAEIEREKALDPLLAPERDE
jgi:DNA invertase Pin-like site-specific DNA recombinase